MINSSPLTFVSPPPSLIVLTLILKVYYCIYYYIIITVTVSFKIHSIPNFLKWKYIFQFSFRFRSKYPISGNRKHLESSKMLKDMDDVVGLEAH